MNDFLVQIILAVRNSDGKDTNWMQMLVFAILAVFYVLGIILKAKTNKLKDKDQEQPSGKAGIKPAESARAPKAFPKTPYQQVQRPVGRTISRQPRPQVSATGGPRRKVVRPQPVVQKVATKKEQAIGLEAIELPEISELSLPSLQLQPDFKELKELPEFAGKPIKKLEEDKGVGIPAEIPHAKAVTEPLLDYADPDKLRRAILHYEILGKPLSLRGPGEQIIGL